VRRLEFLIPGDLAAPTGGYVYDRRIARGLRGMGWHVGVRGLDASFPRPTPAALVRAGEILAQTPSDALVLIDGLAMGAMPDRVVAESRRLRLVALVHHPLCAESGLTEEQATLLRDSEQTAVVAARRVVVTSRHTAGLVADLGVPAARIDVVEPGTDPAPLARGSGSETLHLLCVAALTYRKGHGVLIDALAALKNRNWHLTCVGSLDRDPETVSVLRRRLARLGLERRVTLTGELGSAALADRYHRADVFVLATRFEGYGMALAEALARGLPVLSTRTGAVADTVPNEAGILVPPDDPASLAQALAEVMDDPALRARLARGARRARGLLTGWGRACRRMDRALRAALS
jgi:glycosyltransferase involved in cell wall biosynthesis